MATATAKAPRINQPKLEMDKLSEVEFDSTKIKNQLTKTIGESKTKQIFYEYQKSEDKSYKNLVRLTSEALSDDNNSIPFKDKAILTSTSMNRRYRKPGNDSKTPSTLCNSPISKLSDKIGKFFNDQASEEDFYKALLKNNIDPESKQVQKILSSLDLVSNKSHYKAISSLLKVKDTKLRQEEELENKIVKSPMVQTMTSFQDSSYKDDLGIQTSKKKRIDTVSTNANTANVFESRGRVSDDAKTGTLKEKVLSPEHKNKKIEFMTESSIFKKPSTEEDVSSANKFSGSILQNFSSKKTFSHKNKLEVPISNNPAKAATQYKNVVSEENLTANIKKPKPEDTQVKIIGLYGYAKKGTVSDVDQSKSSYKEIFCAPSKKERNSASANKAQSSAILATEPKKEEQTKEKEKKINSIQVSSTGNGFTKLKSSNPISSNNKKETESETSSVSSSKGFKSLTKKA